VSRRKKSPAPPTAADKLMQLKFAHWLAWQPYVRRYGWIHVAVMMMTIFAMSLTGSVFGTAFFPHDYPMMEYVLFVMFGGCLVMCLCFIALLRGYPKAVWGLFTMLVFCLSITLLVMLEAGHVGFAWIAAVPALIGLYLMSKRRYQRGIKVLQVGDRIRRRIKRLEASLKHTL
jgi:Na+/melibiose symporter-like transporter